MRWRLAALFVLATVPALAQEIPDAVFADQPEAPPVRGTDRDLTVKAFVDGAAQSNDWHREAVALPSSYDRPRWDGWSSFDLRLEAHPADNVALVFSDRLDLC